MTQAEPVVYVVDDDAAMRRSLTFLLESVQQRVETFSNAEEFLSAYDPNRPGCLLLDVRMPGMSGLELQSELAAMKCLLPVIVISGHGDVPMAIRAMKNGALDFIEKPFNQQTLIERVGEAIGRNSRDRRVHALSANTEARLALLTAREREVMDLVVSGLTSRAIADRLKISHKTIEVHRNHIMAKLRVNGVVELVQLALGASQRGAVPSTNAGGG